MFDFLIPLHFAILTLRQANSRGTSAATAPLESSASDDIQPQIS